jgi:hypothetical protein
MKTSNENDNSSDHITCFVLKKALIEVVAQKLHCVLTCAYVSITQRDEISYKLG